MRKSKSRMGGWGEGRQHISGEEAHLHGETRQAEAEPTWKPDEEIPIKKAAAAAEFGLSPPRFLISLTPRVQPSLNLPYSVSNFNTEPLCISSCHLHCPKTDIRLGTFTHMFQTAFPPGFPSRKRKKKTLSSGSMNWALHSPISKSFHVIFAYCSDASINLNRFKI